MPPFADQLRRLKVAVATGRIPPDLAEWAVAELARRADHAERIDLRDRLLCEAARTLLPDGTTWARAEALRAEIARAHRARGLVAEALTIDPGTPRSARQLARILTSRHW